MPKTLGAQGSAGAAVIRGHTDEGVAALPAGAARCMSNAKGPPHAGAGSGERLFGCVGRMKQWMVEGTRVAQVDASAPQRLAHDCVRALGVCSRGVCSARTCPLRGCVVMYARGEE